MSDHILHIQRYLRSGGTYRELELTYDVYATQHSLYKSLVQFNYDIAANFYVPLVRECRGLILDARNNYAVVARAMDKFPSYGEQYGFPIDWKSARYHEKIDGSLIILYPYASGWHFATAGFPDASGKVGEHSFTFRQLATQTFSAAPWFMRFPLTTEVCFWFELTSVYNKVVCLADTPRLTLLGARNIKTQQELTIEAASEFFPGRPVIRSFPFKSLQEVLATLPDMNGSEQEGYVACDGSFNRVKIKCPSYLRLHMMRDIVACKRGIVDVVRNGEVDAVIEAFPERKSSLMEAQGRYNNLLENLHTTYEKTKGIEDQKEFALAVCKVPMRGALFSFRKGKVKSFEEHIRGLHIDAVMQVLDYKGSDPP